MKGFLRCALTGLALLSSAAGAVADDFYKGRTVTIIISGEGTFDTYARLLARTMPKSIPGEPTMIVKSMQGAAGLRAANHMFNVAAKDGSEIAGVHSQVATRPLFSTAGVQYDPLKFEWLGSVTKGLYIGYVMASAPAQSIEEALSKELIVGGQSVGAMPIDAAVMANAMIGTKLKIVSGYPGATDARLAVERGELHGEFGILLTTLRVSKPDWLPTKKAKVIVQMGLTKHRDLPDVPRLIDFAKTEEDRAAMEVYLSRQEIDKPYLAPPGVPAERVSILRKAFDAAVRDPAFLAETQKMSLDVDGSMTGQEVAALVARTLKQPAAAARRVSDLLESYGKK